MFRYFCLVLGLIYLTATTSASHQECCDADVIFVIDITSGLTDKDWLYVSSFMSGVTQSCMSSPCDKMRLAIVEYGGKARIRFGFNRYHNTEDMVHVTANYMYETSLGDTSNAKAGFSGAIRILNKKAYGHRQNAPVTLFWVVHSQPDDMLQLVRAADYLQNNFGNVQVIIVAIGSSVNVDYISSVALYDEHIFSVSSCSELSSIVKLVASVNLCIGGPHPTPLPTLPVTQAPTTRPSTTFILPTTPAPTTTTTKTTTTTPTTTTTTPTTTTTTPTTTTTTPTTTTPTTTTTTPTTTTPTTTTTTTPTTTTTTTPTTTTPTTTTTTTFVPTTPSTTTLPDFPDAIVADDFCFQCRMRRNHKDLYPDETECHHYYQCFYLNETSAFGIRRVCPDGTFWHDSIMQCMPEGNVPCFDWCMNDTVAAKGCYPGIGCRQYYVCANTASYGMCCPVGTLYDDSTCSCIESSTCDDPCVQEGPETPTTVEPSNTFNSTVCQDSWGTYISTVPGIPNAFVLIDLEGHATEQQFCTSGVLFDLGTCSCSIYDETAVAPEPIVLRRALVWLSFDITTDDESTNRFSTFLYDGAERDAAVSAYGSGSLFVDNGYLSIPGLKTFDFLASGSWCAFFRCESGNGFNCVSNGGVVSNNKDSSSTEYTVVAGTQPTNGFTTRLGFWHPVQTQETTGSINVPADGWNHFCLTYDSNTITLYLNGAIANTAFVGGYLKVAHCPFVIGHDQDLGYFIGHIDDVLITVFAMTPAEVNAHYTGNRAELQSLGFF